MNSTTTRAALACIALAAAAGAFAQEAVIRKVLAERLPQLKIDEVSKSPINGMYEVRFNGTSIMYADEKAEYVISGSLIDTKTRADLTEARIDKLLALDFDKLPLADAMVIKQGAGTRKIAVFVDPNCGYCKRFERDLAGIKDLTVYTFLIPILGPDSTAKSRDIWCSKDPSTAWRAWMLDGVAPVRAMKCDTAPIERNLAFAKTQRINGTPAMFFVDGSRKPGALPGPEIERLLVAATSAAKKQ